jgi:hypothetical protein
MQSLTVLHVHVNLASFALQAVIAFLFPLLRKHILSCLIFTGSHRFFSSLNPIVLKDLETRKCQHNRVPKSADERARRRKGTEAREMDIESKRGRWGSWKKE